MEIFFISFHFFIYNNISILLYIFNNIKNMKYKTVFLEKNSVSVLKFFFFFIQYDMISK